MPSAGDDRPSAESLLAKFLGDFERSVEASPEDLFARHPGRSEELRRVWDEHLRALRALKGASPEESVPLPTSRAAGAMPAHRALKTLAMGKARDTEAAGDLPQLAFGPGAQIGDFTLVELIGEGGMGMVWRAEQRSLNRTVALKVMRPERVSPKALDLFAREARAGGRQLSQRSLIPWSRSDSV